ncbi:GNAT family N-acetyltransferase [Paenibacillus sp. NFR01]|uniref:GNAT family N-acetyltransferase n=1 Tax=Paenibacillus sp. NFR01 TaxID=1566279 RepID=UPI0008C7B1A4|nr:GNAT family N-acetyltransferase [Paenibacillus sp. NFR01]SEU10960.1 Ribosomal protein S18 acetylase RimI [Paenibacillus sp. NFR01]
MTKSYQFFNMTDFSPARIEELRLLEQQCKMFDHSSLRIGIDSIKEDGDRAVLCYDDIRLAGCLSWYTSDGVTADINVMVHPGYRRQGIFRGLLELAQTGMRDIREFRFRVPADSAPGMDVMRHLGGRLTTSQFTMILEQRTVSTPGGSGLFLRPRNEEDYEFMIRCLSQAFGDSESWTRNYVARSSEAGRSVFIAVEGSRPVGLVGVNELNPQTAVIYDLCVLPADQGRGLGRQMLSSLVRLLQPRGYTELRLSVVTGNKHALNLYRSAGFAVSAEFHYFLLEK